MDVPTTQQVSFGNRIRTSYSALDYVYNGRQKGDTFAVKNPPPHGVILRFLHESAEVCFVSDRAETFKGGEMF